jgi:hypothetical protein
MDDQQPVSKLKPKKVLKQKAAVKAPRRRRRGGRFINFLLFVGIIAAIGLFSWAEMQRRDAVGRLQATEQELEEIRESTQQSGTEVAKRVLDSVRQLMDVPEEPEPTVATIVDVASLRETSEFYDNAENGDHLIITSNRAILYNSDRNIIIDVVPVRIEPDAEGQQPPADGEEPDELQEPEEKIDPITGEVIEPSPEAEEISPVKESVTPLPESETSEEPI